MKILLAGVIVLAAMTSAAQAQPESPNLFEAAFDAFADAMGALASPPPPPVRRQEAARFNRDLRADRQRDPDPQVGLNMLRTRGSHHLGGF